MALPMRELTAWAGGSTRQEPATPLSSLIPHISLKLTGKMQSCRELSILFPATQPTSPGWGALPP